MTLTLLPKIEPFTWDNDLIGAVTTLNRPMMSCYRAPYPAVVAGRGSDLDKEVRIENVSADHVPVFRRQGGGCTVFLDTGTVIVSVAYPEKGIAGIRDQFDRCTQWLIQGLLKIGVTGVYQSGISDLVIDNFKVGGSCLKRSKDFVYFSAVLLVSCNLDRMQQYLHHPPREPDYRNGRSHKAFVRNLDAFFSHLTVPDVVEGLKRCPVFK